MDIILYTHSMWPICSKCNKPVEKLVRVASPLGDLIFRAHCHGDVDQMTIDADDLKEEPFILYGGVAFNPPHQKVNLLT